MVHLNLKSQILYRWNYLKPRRHPLPRDLKKDVKNNNR